MRLVSKLPQLKCYNIFENYFGRFFMKKRITKVKIISLGSMHFYSKSLLIINAKTNRVFTSNINSSSYFPSYKSSYQIAHKDIKEVFTIIQPLIENWHEQYHKFVYDGWTQDLHFYYNDGSVKKVSITCDFGPASMKSVLEQLWSLKDKEKEESHIRYIKNPKTPLSRLRNPKSRPRLEFDNKRQFKKLNQQNA